MSTQTVDGTGHIFTPGAVGSTSIPHTVPCTAAFTTPAGYPVPVLVATLGPVPTGQVWSVHRITVVANRASTALVYVGDPGSSSNFVEGSNYGANDTDSCVPALIVPAGQSLNVVWPDLTVATLGSSGGNPVDVATARIEYDQIGGS